MKERGERVILSRAWWPLVTGVLVLGLSWTAATRAEPAGTTNGAPPPSPREGFSAPAFSLPTRDERTLALTDLRGQVVVLNFWASWCVPCQAEMPAREATHQALRSQGLVILGVNTTFQDDELAARAFADRLGISFATVFDHSGEMSGAYQLRATPTTFFVDRRGVIRAVVIGGPLSEALLRSQVEALLAEAP